MNSVLESVISNAISLGLSTIVGFILFVFGVNTQTTVTVATGVLFGFAVLFLMARKHYPRYKRRRTRRLLDQALNVKENETDEEKVVFKAKIIGRVQLENAGVQLQGDSSVVEFMNLRKKFEQKCAMCFIFSTFLPSASRTLRSNATMSDQISKYCFSMM